MSYAIRQLQASDLELYRALRLEALEGHPEAFASSAEDFVRKSDATVRQMLESLSVYGAVLDDKSLGGMVAFMRAEPGKEYHRGWLLQVYVQPAHRGSGMAEALMRHAIAHVPEGVLQLHLGVWSENEPALRLYKRLGFEIYGTEPRYLFVNGRYIDEHLMVRFLDKAPGEEHD